MRDPIEIPIDLSGSRLRLRLVCLGSDEDFD